MKIVNFLSGALFVLIGLSAHAEMTVDVSGMYSQGVLMMNGSWTFKPNQPQLLSVIQEDIRQNSCGAIWVRAIARSIVKAEDNPIALYIRRMIFRSGSGPMFEFAPECTYKWSSQKKNWQWGSYLLF